MMLVDTGPQLLTAEQVAQLLQVPSATLQVWRSTKRVALQWVKVGGHVRYRVADVEQFIARGLRNATNIEGTST